MIERNDERPDERELSGVLDTTIESDDAAGKARSAAVERAQGEEGAQPEPPAARAKRASRRKTAAKRTDGKAERASILKMPAREAEVATDEREREGAELEELTAQGFTPDEAQRLLFISDRLATSYEAREAEATLRRLRFTRWLIEHGVLDEFSA
jgi:hypothetical protein